MHIQRVAVVFYQEVMFFLKGIHNCVLIHNFTITFFSYVTFNEEAFVLSLLQCEVKLWNSAVGASCLIELSLTRF